VTLRLPYLIFVRLTGWMPLPQIAADKTPGALNRQVSNAIYARLRADPGLVQRRRNP
jgi:hypothetical protein